MTINVYKHKVGAKNAVRLSVTETRSYPDKGDVDTALFVTGYWASSPPEDPALVLGNRLKNWLERDLTDDERKQIVDGLAAL